MIAVMVILGLVTGLIFGKASGKSALMILVLLLSGSGLRAHGDEDHSAEAEVSLRSITTAGWVAEVRFTPDPPSVGDPGIVTLMVKDQKTGKPLKAASVHITVDIVEYETPVFETSSLLVDGKVSYGFGYFDGSGHTVTFDIVPSGEGEKAFSVTFENKVGGKEPPPAAKYMTVAVLMLLMLGGFVLGFTISRPKSA